LTAKLTGNAIRLIEGKNFAHLATLMLDGSPHVTPMWVDHDGDFVLMNTAEGRVKLRNMARDPRVSISVADQNNPYDKVVIRGRVVAKTNEGADAHIDKLAKKYQKSRPDETRVIIKIEPTHVC